MMEGFTRSSSIVDSAAKGSTKWGRQSYLRAHFMGSRRVRQHVNPLGLRFLAPRANRIDVPAHLGTCEVDVELGCADAQFSFQLAEREPRRFVVGLEIREKLVEANIQRAKDVGLRNLAFGYVNLNVDLDRVFGFGAVDRFHVLFPDPWFKSRHHKRRVLEPGLCRVIASQLKQGGELHFASDVYELALEAMAELESNEAYALGFRNMVEPWRFFRGNPFGVSSRREDTTLRRGQRVWRIRYRCEQG